MRHTRWLLAVSAVTALCHAPAFLYRFLDGDEGTYAAVAALLGAGGRLYGTGGVDNKFPAIYATYAALFRLFGRYAMGAVHAAALVVVLLTGLVLARAARRLAGPGAGLLAALFWGLFSTVPTPKLLAAQTELFMMLPLAGSFLLLLGRRGPRALGLAGALLGLGCLYKQIAGVQLGWSLLVCLRARSVGGRPVRDALALAAGSALVLGGAAAILGARGELSGLWHWALVRLVARYGASAWGSRRILDAALGGLLPAVAGWALLFFAAAPALARLGRAPAGERLALGWLGASALGVVAGGRFFGHYFLGLLGPLALVAAVELERRLEGAPARARRRLRAGIAAGIAVPALGALLFALLFEPFGGGVGRPRPDYPAVVAAVRARTSPSDRIFVWGSSGALYLACERLPASRFVGFLRGLDRGRGEPPERAWDLGPEVAPLLAEDLRAHPPALIVDTASSPENDLYAYPLARFPAVAALFSGYRPLATIDGVTLRARPDAGSP